MATTRADALGRMRGLVWDGGGGRDSPIVQEEIRDRFAAEGVGD